MVCTIILAHISELSDIEYRTAIKFFTHKDLGATKIYKELHDVYRNSAPSYRAVTR